MNKGRSDERLKDRVEESTCLTYTGLHDKTQSNPKPSPGPTDPIGFVYHESIKRGLQRRLIYEYQCDERLKTKNEESTRLVDTGLVLELEHLKTKTRLKDEKFASVKGECET
jgi:hypothetical protein